MDTAPFVEYKGDLKFRYIVAYLVEGLQSPAGGIRSLYPADKKGKSVSLTDNANESWRHIDAVHTISRLLLDKFLGGVDFDPNQFKSYLSATNQERVNRYGPNTAFLIVEASHEEDGARIGPIGITDEREYCLAFANGFMDEVEPRHKAFLDESLAFLSFAMPSVSGLDLAGKCVVADHPSGKPLYVITPSMSARASVLKPIPADGPELFATLFRHSVELEHFQTAFQLSADSSLNARDNLRAFLFAYTALESFLKRFSSQHKLHLRQLRKEQKDNLSPAASRGSGLSKKFAMIASYLGTNNLDETIAEFEDVTNHRNAIAHGDPFKQAELPTAKVRKLMGELMRLQAARYITSLKA